MRKTPTMHQNYFNLTTPPNSILENMKIMPFYQKFDHSLILLQATQSLIIHSVRNSVVPNVLMYIFFADPIIIHGDRGPVKGTNGKLIDISPAASLQG